MGKRREISQLQLDAIREAHQAGWSLQEIATYVKLPKTTVWRLIRAETVSLHHPHILSKDGEPFVETIPIACYCCGGKIEAREPTFCLHCATFNDPHDERLKPSPKERAEHRKAWTQAHPESSPLRGGKS